MISELIGYGAVYGKTRALYGYRLMPEDFRRIGIMKDVSEIAGYLKEIPGWAECLQGVKTANISRRDLEGALRMQYLDEFLRIYKYMRREDKRIMNFPILQIEAEQILTALRSLHSAQVSNTSNYAVMLPLGQNIQAHSKIDYKKLAASSDYIQLLDAVHKTIYFEPMTILPAKNGLPNYLEAELVVQTAYYKEIYAAAKKDYTKKIRDKIYEYIGAEIDLFNIIRLVRLKKNFPNITNNVFSFLLPFNYKLSHNIIRELHEVPNENAMLEILKTTFYRKLFSDHKFRDIEDYYGRMHYLNSRRMFLYGFPSVITAMSYLNLKRIEFNNLTHVIESVRYGVEPQMHKIW